RRALALAVRRSSRSAALSPRARAARPRKGGTRRTAARRKSRAPRAAPGARRSRAARAEARLRDARIVTGTRRADPHGDAWRESAPNTAPRTGVENRPADRRRTPPRWLPAGRRPADRRRPP